MHLRAYALFFALIGICSLSSAQVKFNAYSNAQEVVENGVFTVEFRLENTSATRIIPPEFKEFDVVGGPDRSQSTTIINGKVKSSVSWSYSLLAKKEGTFRIGPATAVVDGNRLQTKPFSIRVVKAAKDANGNLTDEAQIILRAEIDSADIYPGQQAFLHYKIYTQLNIRDFSSLSEDKYEDFYFRYVRDFDRRPKQVVIDGRQYTSQVVKSIALFPQKTGTFDIDPYVLNVWVPQPGSGNSRSFLRRFNNINKRIASNSARLNVIPLPENPPPTFTGGVGEYQINTRIDKRQMTTDDALVLRMQVIGNGDSRRWSAPDIGLDDDFEVYEPSIVTEKSVDQNGKIITEKIFEYLMIPKRTGTLRFVAPFSYFNPDSTQYVTLKSPVHTVHVSQGKNGKRALTEAIQQESESEKIEPFINDTTLRTSGKSFFLSPAYWVMSILPFGFLGVVLYKDRKKAGYLSLDPAERKHREARLKALGRLKEAEAKMSEADHKMFYESISKAIYGYVSDKLRIPMADLSTSTIANKVDQLNVEAKDREALLGILSQCQLMLYGAGGETDQRQSVYDNTLGLITELEKQFSA